ncbi:MAG TPA: thiamine pyrophosphate-binding protein [Gemmataceae bacterium]|nr:thiamine pyrophosphate-binding protein [Gemmataceae bacterium]
MSIELSRREVLQAVAAGCVVGMTADLARGHGEPPGPGGCVSGTMTGAQALVDTLLTEGVECVYGIPGAQDNELWDSMKSRGLGYLLCTHEFSAACMADGYARTKGKPGVLCVVPGPGVTNCLTGIGEALLDSIPMVVIVTDIAQGDKYRPYQLHALPNVALLQPVTKCVLAVQEACQIPAMVRQAFCLARSGEPGPVGVVIPFPLYIQTAKFSCPPPCLPEVPFDEAAFQRALSMLSNRRCRVGIYAGLGCMDYGPALAQVAELLQAPVATSVSGKGCIPENHPLAVGWGYGGQGTRTAEKVFKDVDLVLAIGVRYSEVSTASYAIPPHPVIQVDINRDNLGAIVKPCVCVHADAGVFLGKLLENEACLRRPCNGKLIGEIGALRRVDYQKNSEVYATCGVDPMQLVLALRRCLCPEALLFVDVTAAEHWAAEAFHVCLPRTYFNPTDNQVMGWSIGASIGAQRVNPGRTVVTITGDGCFLMSAMEISTAARECLPVKFFVIDDQAYHIMQVLQKPAYLRTTATILARLDYGALARGLGVGYQEILSNDCLEAGIRGALECPGPMLVRVAVDYGKRPMRWTEAAKKQYTKELTTQQKARFLARIGARAVHVRKEND